ncbi:mucin-3A-like isoform X2 [Zootermopsis nevadensis]|uniref:mucin-3A-like isoform X2 n=1 Tax=Zootermopsis nevadensis TaxID=136037 RepID=UPI000B8E44DC|nr:mucin-3A-like isoform X2 [Zootermopsis nevadensis]
MSALHVLLLAAIMDVAIHQEVNGFIHFKRVRTRRSEHSEGILELFKNTNKTMLESNIRNLENSSGPMPDSPVFDDKMSFNDITTQNEIEFTVGESSAGKLIQPDRENPFSLVKTSAKSEDKGPMSFENSRTQPNTEIKTHNRSEVESDIQILRRNISSLYQYSNGTDETPGVQAQYEMLNDTAVNDTVKDINSENITKNFNSQTDIEKKSNKLISVKGTESTSTPQSSKNILIFANTHSRPALSTNSLPTPNHVTRVLYSNVTSSSNNNGSTLPSNTSTPALPSYITITTTQSTTPFLDLNQNLTEDMKFVDQAVNNTMYTVPSNSSEYNLKDQTRKFPDDETVYTIIPGKLHTALRFPQNVSSFTLSTLSKTKNKLKTSEDGPSFHSEFSVKLTTSTATPPLFYLSDANISTESFPRNLSVTSKSTESANVRESTDQSSNTESLPNFPQVSHVLVPTVNNATSLGTPEPASKLSSLISPMQIPESVITYPIHIVPSTETITSSATVSPVLSVKAVTSSTIISTVSSVGNITSNKTSGVVNSIETVILDPINKTVTLLETVMSTIASSTMPLVATPNSVSSTVPETVTLGTISNTVPEIVTLGTISSTVPEIVTPSKIFSIVSSVGNTTSNKASRVVNSTQTVISEPINKTVSLLETVMSTIVSNTEPLSANTNLISSTVTETATPSTVYSIVPSIETVTTSTISTPYFSTVSSTNYALATKEPRKINQFQVGISGKNQSTHKTEEYIRTSLKNLSANRNSTSLNVTHEKLFFKSEKLTDRQKREDPLTIIFKGEMEVAEWFLILDMEFRRYFSKALTECKRLQEKWKKTFSPEDIWYVSPGPFVTGENLTICILVKNPAVEEGNMFISGKYLQKCLQEVTPNLNQMLNVEIIDTVIRITLPKQYQCSVQETRTNDDKMKLTIAMSVIIVIFMSIIAALMLVIKYRQHHGLFEPPTGLSYRLPCHNDGRHLATDEDCVATEGSNAQPQEAKQEKANGSTPSTSKNTVNVKLISKEEHENYRVCMYTIALYSFSRKLEVCSSEIRDPQKMKKCSNIDAKEEILMAQLHKPPLISED